MTQGTTIWCRWCQGYFQHPRQPGPKPKACVQHRLVMQAETAERHEKVRTRRRHEAWVPRPSARVLPPANGSVLGADGGRYAVPPVGGEAIAQVPGALYRDEPRRVVVVSAPRVHSVRSTDPAVSGASRQVLVTVLVEGESKPRPLAVERFPELVA